MRNETVDVYKRQLMAHSDQGFRNGRAKTPQAPDNKLFLFVHSYAPSPVSYTHLDVYKRQFKASPPQDEKGRRKPERVPAAFFLVAEDFDAAMA